MMKVADIISNAIGTDTDKLGVISQNLANANKAGYKRQIEFSVTLDELTSVSDSNKLNSLPLNKMTSDTTQGSLKKTGNNLDLVASGDGYFVMRSVNGDNYTRQAHLKVNNDGVLSFGNDLPVMGSKGEIYVGSEPFEILNNGNVIQGGEVIDQLKLTKFEHDQNTTYKGNGIYKVDGKITNIPHNEINLMVGFEESSNVDMIYEMTLLTELVRHFEASSNVFKSYDEMLASSIDTLGQF